MIDLDGDKGNSCLIHPGTSHDVETCPIAEELLQGMMNRGQIKVCSVKKGEGDVYMQSNNRNPGKLKPLAVPWKYATQGSDGRKDGSVIRVKEDLPSVKVTNISGMSGMTHSGWIFTVPELLVWSKDKGKAKTDIGERDKVGSTPNDEVPVGKITAEGDDFSKKEISAEEAIEFLRIIQQSEFKVIEQLNKTPTRISLLGLLMNSEPHRAQLVKILNEAHVAQHISMEGFGGIVNNITANNYLTFSDKEILVEGRGHNKALHVSVKCLDHIVAKVLIDSSSSLNVIPKTTLDKLPFNASHMRPSSKVVRAFDGSHRDIRGDINLPIKIRPHVYQITFQIMDICPAYSCLLGRPWIHSTGVVLSMLHQKLKFVVKGQLVIVSGEEDISVSCPSSTLYVEAAKESFKTLFQALEIMSSAYAESPPVQPRIFGVALMVALVMLRDRYEPKMGLGRNGDGMASLVEFAENRGRSNNESCESSDTEDPDVDFEQLINQAEKGEDED
ncbi:uncharacterized protein [Glycine max]|uniref:uncharacterized protein n=1 Tax=Glycine max TaxID=3847 RepID=UPI0003DED856|nr:uncharacterized protein LOC100793606 [Glycine max]|eukprot:XP_006596811.1 uncharacterized protein LOC100793606 [Glycine max]